jgi:sulfur carrier protein
MITLTLNGEERQTSSSTIAELLTEIDAPIRGIAIEKNSEIIPKSSHAESMLKEGDVVEIISFIGGG